MPITRPSHFSLFTGRYPREHGVVNNQLELPEGEVTLAEVFREAGYRTGAFSGTRLFQPSSGAPQGFDHYAASEEHQEPGAAVVDRALAWLGDVPEGERLFLWVHLYDPHMPYTPPRDLVPEEPPAVPGLERGATWRGLKAIAARTGGGLDEAAARRVRALYDAEVASADRQVERLLEALDRRSGLEPVVAFTTDHGECFDHRYFHGHSDWLYEGALWVPLVVQGSGRLEAGCRMAGTVEVVDLGASLLRLAGVAPPPSFREGRPVHGPAQRRRGRRCAGGGLLPAGPLGPPGCRRAPADLGRHRVGGEGAGVAGAPEPGRAGGGASPGAGSTSWGAPLARSSTTWQPTPPNGATWPSGSGAGPRSSKL